MLQNIHCVGCVGCVGCVVFCSYKMLQNATKCYKMLQNTTKQTQYNTQQWDACCQIKLVLPNELAYKYALYRLCRLCSLCSILQLQNATNATKCYRMLKKVHSTHNSTNNSWTFIVNSSLYCKKNLLTNIQFVGYVVYV